jgi:serine/threonine protein kinase
MSRYLCCSACIWQLAVHMDTGAQVAIKILDKGGLNKQNMASQIKKEISLMKRFEHRNVVRLIEVLASRTKVFIVLELVTGGELFDVIKAHGRLEETIARRYFRQLIEGVQHCHMQVSLALLCSTCVLCRAIMLNTQLHCNS